MSVHETVDPFTAEVVIVERTKWHLRLGAFAAFFFFCLCLWGVDYQESPIWFWITKGIALFICLPVLILLLYNLKFQEPAVTLCGSTLRFATMNPGGRATFDVNDILDCTYEAIPELHEHLILTVSPGCYQVHKDSNAWAATSVCEFRFDMTYTSPSLSKCVQRIRQRIPSEHASHPPQTASNEYDRTDFQS